MTVSEGSKGGHVIGHTHSGKPIYDSSHAQTGHAVRVLGVARQSDQRGDAARQKYFSDWSHDDHYAASHIHAKAGNDGAARAHQRMASMAMRHAHEAEKSMKKSGAGSHGGKVIGYTRAGKAIYDAKFGEGFGSTSPYTKAAQMWAGSQPSQAMAHVMKMYPAYTQADHADAANFHEMMAAHHTKGVNSNKHSMINAHKNAAGIHSKVSAQMSTGVLDVIAGKSLTPDLVKAKGEGSKGGSVIGHTRSGKAIYSGSHSRYTETAKFPKSWTSDDHKDAASLHRQVKEKHTSDAKTIVHRHEMETGKKFSYDHPPSDQMGGDRLVSFRDSWNQARQADWAARMHDQHSAKKSTTPDFCKALGDIVNKMDVVMIQEADAQRVTAPYLTHTLNPGGDGGVPTKVAQVNVNPAGLESGDIMTFRVDILAPTPMSNIETMAMVKSIMELPANCRQTELVRCGLNVVGPRRVDLNKSTMTLVEFADAVGTTEDTVRRIAKRCGDPQHFVALIRDKMPDIQRAHSLSDSDASALYSVASRTLKSLNPLQWGQWCSKSFASEQVTDQGLADAIAMNGIMHRNQCTSGGFSIMGGPVTTEPHRDLASPEPIAQPLEHRPLIGGNLATGIRSTDLSPYAFRS